MSYAEYQQWINSQKPKKRPKPTAAGAQRARRELKATKLLEEKKREHHILMVQRPQLLPITIAKEE